MHDCDLDLRGKPQGAQKKYQEQNTRNKKDEDCLMQNIPDEQMFREGERDISTHP